MTEKDVILIVDDERFNLNILADLLKTNYTVLLAKDGRQALNRAINQKPDLILLDIIMPEMDGYQVLLELKNNEATKDIPVIFISALSARDDEEKGLSLGAVDYIAKPFSPAIVKARVKNHLKIVHQRKLLESIALLDGLTEIPNRRSYEERFTLEWKRAVREQSPVSLALIDVDCFKQYNDHYGHAQGDDVLRAVAAVLKQGLRRPADFSARYGGEEFVMLMPGVEAAGAKTVAEMIRTDVENLRIEHGFCLGHGVLTVSIGGATTIPNLGAENTSLFQKADQMLYQAKRLGRNRVTWTVNPNLG